MSATKNYADLTNLTLYDELIKDYIDAKKIELTQAEYNQLSYAEKHNGSVYYITDAPGTSGIADEVAYDNTTSGLTSTNVQDAIDEVYSQIGSGEAADIEYDNTSSGMTADDVQDAIDELNTEKANGEGLTFSVNNGILRVTYDDGTPTV